jgi:hypothetical protein
VRLSRVARVLIMKGEEDGGGERGRARARTGADEAGREKEDARARFPLRFHETRALLRGM